MDRLVLLINTQMDATIGTVKTISPDGTRSALMNITVELKQNTPLLRRTVVRKTPLSEMAIKCRDLKDII